MNSVQKIAFWCAGLAGLLLIGVMVVFLSAGAFSGRSGGPGAPADGVESEPPEVEEGVVAVHTIHPKCDPTFTLSVKAPALVEAYEWADLKAQVAGAVTYIRKAEGSPVTAGELLIKIAVPDLDEAVRQKESIIRQRQAEFEVAQANERIAQAAVGVATKAIDVAQAAVGEAEATRDYRGKELQRFKGLVADHATVQQIVDETERYYQAALSATAKAQADVLRAKMSLAEAQEKLQAAKADVKLKRELIAVAEKDRDHAQAVADYAKITAPFDGVVTKRTVNPGSFVQNATTANTPPLLRVERRDIVTVTMRVPDTFAPFVNNDTEAVIEISELPGQEIHGKVTRFSPTLESQTSDHTLPVQVDLYNGTEADYQAFLARERAKKEPFDDLKEGALPLVPNIKGAQSEEVHRLLPGMYGEMKLVFRHLQNVFLIPSDAVLRGGGTPSIYVVKDGRAVRLPVEIQVDDQRVARVAVIQKAPNGGTVKRPLTGSDEVIDSHQSELTDGEPVRAIPGDWNP